MMMQQVGCAVAAAGVAAAVRPWLAQAAYRRPHEHQDLPRRSHAWVIPAAALGAFAMARQPPAWAGYGVVAAAAMVWLVLISAIDLDVHRLPDRWTYTGAGAICAALGVVALTQGEPVRWGHALAGAGILSGAFLALAVLGALLKQGGGMGLGDVKLALGIGALVGYRSYGGLFVVTLLTFALASLVGVSLVLVAYLRRRPRPDEIPLGPYLAAATCATVLMLRG